jgi:hypothetical protein
MKPYFTVSANLYIWFQSDETMKAKTKEVKRVKKTTICLSALLMLGLMASAGFAFAFGAAGNGEHSLAIRQAIEENNFDAWKAAITEALTQEDFDKLVERHKSMSERREMRDAVRQAIEAGDYEAYKEAVGRGSYKVIGEERFNAMASGEFRQFGWHRGFGRHNIFGGI